MCAMSAIIPYFFTHKTCAFSDNVHKIRRKITTNIWNTQGFDDKNRIYLHF